MVDKKEPWDKDQGFPEVEGGLFTAEQVAAENKAIAAAEKKAADTKKKAAADGNVKDLKKAPPKGANKVQTAKNTAGAKAVAKQNSKALTKTDSFNSLLRTELAGQFKTIKSVVPKHLTPERLARIGMAATSRNPGLMECTPESIVGAIVSCAQMGLEPNLIGHSYIVPFYNSKTGKKEAQFQIGYKGWIDLVHRTGAVSEIYAHTVHLNDRMSFKLGLDKDLTHDYDLGVDRGPIVAFYACYKLKDGGKGFVLMSKEEIDIHRKKYSKTGGSGTWVSAYEEMAQKTVIKKLVKFMPVSIEEAVRDEAVLSVKNNILAEGEDDAGFLDVEYVVNDVEDENV
jgi:recombination protein RecT